MAISDKTLTCINCGYEFTFTAGEQEFFSSKGYTNEPKRCTQCRGARKSQQQGFGGFDRPVREMHPAVCAQCGTDTMVPFKPSGVRPVYCSNCFSGIRSDSNR